MTTYGELVRELRIKKGITQKNLYKDIMSKSYAIRFEQGKHEISFYLIHSLLERLEMEIDEFLYIYNGYRESASEQFYSEYSLKGNANDIDGLKSLRNSLAHSPMTYQTQLRLAELNARIDQLTYFNQHGELSKEAITPDSLQTIHLYLDQIQTWTLNELRFFANTLDFIDYERKSEYFKSILPALNRYQNFQRGHPIICTLLINEIHELIMGNELTDAHLFLTKLDKFSNTVETMFFRNSHLYYKGMLYIASGELDLGRPLVEQAIHLYKRLGYHHQAILSEAFYQHLIRRQ